MAHRLTIYTDGGAMPNPGPGAYAFIVLGRDGRIQHQGSQGFERTTNSRMEIMALLEALKAIEIPSKIQAWSDSKYVVNSLLKGWLARWAENGWRLSTGDPVQNRDLWEAMLPEIARHELSIDWVKGHSGNIWNERCDELVHEARHSLSAMRDIGYEAR